MWFSLQILIVKYNLKMVKIRNFNLGMTCRWGWEPSLKLWRLRSDVFWMLCLNLPPRKPKRPPANSRRRLSGPGLRRLSLLSYFHSRPLTPSQLTLSVLISFLSLICLDAYALSDPTVTRVPWSLLISYLALSACIFSRYDCKYLHRCTPPVSWASDKPQAWVLISPGRWILINLHWLWKSTCLPLGQKIRIFFHLK